MRTYKEPKRIDKPRIIESAISSQEPKSFPLPGLSTCGLGSQTCSSPQQENEKREEQTVDLPVKNAESKYETEECGSVPQEEVVQENPDKECSKEDEDLIDKCESTDIKTLPEPVLSETAEKKKVSPKQDKKNNKKIIKDGQKKVVKKKKKIIEKTCENDDKEITENNQNKDLESSSPDKCDIDASKEDSFDHNDELNKTVVQKAKKSVKKKDTLNANKKVKPIKDTKAKTPPKSVTKKKSPKSKKKVDTENSPNKSETETKLCDNESLGKKDDLSASPRSSKRTPKKNRKYESDEEKINDNLEDLTTTDSSGKKKSPKSPRSGVGRKRKLNFEEDCAAEIETADFEEKVENAVPPQPKKRKKVIKKKAAKKLEETDEVNKNDGDLVSDKKTKGDDDSVKPTKVKKKTKVKSAEGDNQKDKVDKEGDTEVKNDRKVKKKKVVRKRKSDIKNQTSSENMEDGDNEQKIGKPKVKRKNNKKKTIKTENQNSGEADSDIKKELKFDEDKVDSVENMDTDSGGNKENNETDDSKMKLEKKKCAVQICPDCGHVSGCKAAYTKHLKKCAARNEIKADIFLQPKIEIQDHTPGSTAESDETVCYSENTPPPATETSLFKCGYCEYGTPKRAMLGRHMRTHGIYVCLRCNFICNSCDGLKDHMSREHKERTDFKLCRNCSRYIKCTDLSLEQHMANCQGPEPFVCAFCNKEFKYESSLKSHIIRHTPDAPKRFTCQQCDYKSNYKANLKKHLANIHGDKIKRVKCEFPDCTKMFFTEDNMKRHLKWHSESRPYKCNKCEKAFKSSAALRGHSVTHDPNRPFKCNINECQKDFRSKKLLKNHQEEFHNLTEKRHHCLFQGCKFSFFKKSHLARHVITHTGERKFGCHICGKAFRHSDNLKIHMRQHTNEKPVRCELCDFACRQKSSLRYHMKKCHGILPPSKDGNSNSNSLQELDMKCEMNDTSAISKTDFTDFSFKITDINEPLKEEDEKLTSLQPVSLNSSNPIDLYEFKSDDEFGEDMAALRQEKPILTPRKINFTSDFIDQVKQEVIANLSNITDNQSGEQTKKEVALVSNKSEIKNEIKEETKDVSESVKNPDSVPEKPKKKVLKKKKKIEKTEEPSEKIDNEQVEQIEPVVKKKKKPGRKPKAAKVETPETNTNQSGLSPKSGAKSKSKVVKVPGKRGRKPKPKIIEQPVVKKKLGRPKKKPDKEEVPENSKKSPPKKKKAVGRKKKVQKVEEKVDDSLYNDDTEVEKEKENSEDENKDLNKTETINIEASVDKLSESPPSIKNDSPCQSPTIQENDILNETQEVKDKLDEISEVEGKERDETEVKEHTAINNDVDEQVEERKTNDALSDATSSGIDTDFEEDLKPPPAPRPPPVVDSDEGDIESGPDDMDTPSRDFESTPPKSVTEPSPRVHHLSGTDTSPRIPSIPGMECKQEMNSSSEYIQHTPKDTEISDVNPADFNIAETSQLQSTQSPINEVVPPVEASNNGTEFGSQSESTMPEVDKDYLGQYLQQFDSSTRSEDETGNRIDRLDTNVVGRSNENINDISPTAHDKDLPPLNLSSSALNLTTTPERGDPMSNKRMEILECDRQQEDHFQGRSDSAPRSPSRQSDSSVYDTYSTVNTFLPPTRDASLLRQGENVFPPTSTNSSFMRFSESDALLQRQRMSTPFIGQSDPNALQNLHRMADSALASHNNPALLRRPTTVPPREDMFTTPAVAQTMTRNPFHNSWAGQEVRPAHWSQAPYLQRSIDRQGGSTSSPLFGKDNYLAGREFMLDASRRSVAERNMFTGLPQSQRPDLAHESFPSLERFDFGYFGGHGYPGAASLDYSRSTCGTSQKTFDERYRQSATGVGDFRTLPQTSSADMFSGINMNSSFNLDKYVYPRDPIYHPQHMADGTNATFLPHGVPTQHTVFDRDYPRGFYHQNSPYSFDKQYAAAAAASASAKLGHTTGSTASSQERDFVPRQNSSSENQMQDPYRHPMLYNMMNRYFE